MGHSVKALQNVLGSSMKREVKFRVECPRKVLWNIQKPLVNAPEIPVDNYR
jgi:hypothetical protein